MILFENTKIYGWEAAVRGMRNPLNSWDRSDSRFENGGSYIGEKDYALMEKLAKAGPVHAKYLRMITVTVDIIAPMYWWQEFDTYKVGTVRNSCSKMHTIHRKEFDTEDFSADHMTEFSKKMLESVINALNFYRAEYLKDISIKQNWWQMIQLLPASYNQRSTVQMNYAVLQHIYPDRKDHKLDEWRDFCRWIRSLPHSGLITEACDDGS